MNLFCSLVTIGILAQLCVCEELPIVTAVILTYARPKSLARVIKSVAASNPPELRIDLHICSDHHDNGLANKDFKETRDIIDKLDWKRGLYSAQLLTKRAGLAAQWLNCVPPRDENMVILEDDVEIAPSAFQWLIAVRRRYTNDKSVIGFSLQRQNNCFHSKCAGQLQIPWSINEYKYKLVGTWGFAPVRKIWEDFKKWKTGIQAKNKSYVPDVPDLLPSKWYSDFVKSKREASMWSMWIIDYCNQKSNYIVYYNHPVPKTLGAHWFEAGEHFDGKRGKPDFTLVPNTPIFPDKFLLKPTPVVLDWTAKFNYSLIDNEQVKLIVEAARFIAKTTPPAITFVNNAFCNMTMHFICNLHRFAPEVIANSLLIATDAEMYNFLLERQPKWRYWVLPLHDKKVSSGSNLKFGTLEYFQFILLRTETLLALTDALIPFFLFETDAFVRVNPVKEFAAIGKKERADIVGLQDNVSFKSKNPNGGFLFFAGTKGAATMWKLVHARFAKNIAAISHQAPTSGANIQNEQDIFTDLGKKNISGVTLAIMNTQEYVSGREMGGSKATALAASAKVILFNFVIGNPTKRKSAVARGLWYYNETSDQCIVPVVPTKQKTK
jgi:hypothetical protein